TLPYELMLANKWYRVAFKSNQPLSLGLNTYKGHVTNKVVAEAFEMEYKSVEESLQL
ncbi:alanine dehydrogenase, partial [Staphylococcus aureus]|nr:alanine dehydrogenase [Staphylococcus aureus]